MPSIAVKHNIEVAHRLFELPGKCEQIHGHSMWVTMKLEGEVNSRGILGGIEYGDLKKLFRGHLDSEYDHRLLLNASDPFAGPIFQVQKVQNEIGGHLTTIPQPQTFLPGLNATLGDPTTENIAKWVASEMVQHLTQNAMITRVDVEVWETSSNMASYGVTL